MARQIDRLRTYFDANAAEWEELYAKPRRVNDLVLANRRRLGLEGVMRHAAAGGRVLDVGCGAGLTSLDLCRNGFRVEGIDIAPGMVALCERRLAEARIATDRYRFTVAELAAAALEPASFDAVIALGFLEYQEDESAALAACFRLLKPGGALVVSGATETTIANWWRIPARVTRRLERWGLRERCSDPERLWLHRYSSARFERLLESAGFRLLECHGHGFVQLAGVAERVGYRGELVIHRALSQVARVVPIGRFGNDTICYARKP